MYAGVGSPLGQHPCVRQRGQRRRHGAHGTVVAPCEPAVLRPLSPCHALSFWCTRAQHPKGVTRTQYELMWRAPAFCRLYGPLGIVPSSILDRESVKIAPAQVDCLGLSPCLGFSPTRGFPRVGVFPVWGLSPYQGFPLLGGCPSWGVVPPVGYPRTWFFPCLGVVPVGVVPSWGLSP